MLNYELKKQLEKQGVKFKYPPKPGFIVPLCNDRMFRIFCKDKNNRKFVAKLINLVTGIDFDLLVDRMVIIDSSTGEDSVVNHYNDQDVIVTLLNTTINLESLLIFILIKEKMKELLLSMQVINIR